MTNLNLNQLVYVIDDMTNNVVLATVQTIDGDITYLKATNSDMQYMRRNGNGIYATAEEASMDREPIAMPTREELILEELDSRFAHIGEVQEAWLPF